MPPAALKPTIPASQRSQTYALNHEATRTGWKPNLIYLKFGFGLFSDMGNFGPKRPERNTSRVDTRSPMPKWPKFWHKNPNKMHMVQSLFYLTTALHVSGVTITHLQEHKTTVTTASGNRYTVLLSAAIVEELELIWVCCGWRTPPTTHSN